MRGARSEREVSMDITGLFQCAHCSGTGTCRAANGCSCDECRKAAAKNLQLNDSSALTVVSCSKCEGKGHRDIKRATFHAERLQNNEKEEITRRTIDGRRKCVTIVALMIGLLLAAAGIFLDEKSSLAVAALTGGISIISGAIGAYVGGERFSSRGTPSDGETQAADEKQV